MRLTKSNVCGEPHPTVEAFCLKPLLKGETCQEHNASIEYDLIWHTKNYMKVGDVVKEDRKCYFSHYRQGYLYYTVTVPDERGLVNYVFPVEIADLGTATVSNEEKSIYLMRYIRKAIDNETFVLNG